MSNYLNLGPTGQGIISEFEYKKLFNYPTARLNSRFNQEIPYDSRDYIYTDQILSNSIPPKAPTDMIKDTSFVQFNGYGERYYSLSNPYIVRYNNILLSSSQ